MPSAEPAFAPRRIVVALDSSRHAAAAAEAAVRLAARFRAALEGLFVEDEDLVNLAGLPVARLVTFPEGKAGAFDAGALERHLRGERALARRALESVAARLGVPSRFSVRRGRVESELIAAAAGADLVIVGRASRTAGRARAGTLAIALAEHAAGSVLVHRAGAGPGENPVVCFDASPGARRALEAGFAIAARDGHRLRIAILARDAEEAVRLREQAAAALAPRGVEADFLDCVPASAERLCELAGSAGRDSIVVAAASALLHGEHCRALLARAPCPVLVVR